MKPTIVIVLVLTLQAFVEARVCPCKCCDGPNEEYRICGSMCERSCANLDDCDLCPAVCVPGCFCKDGYVRDLDGACVLPCDCPPVTTTLAPATTRKKCKCKPPTTTTEAPCVCSTTTTKAPCLSSTTTKAPCR